MNFKNLPKDMPRNAEEGLERIKQIMEDDNAPTEQKEAALKILVLVAKKAQPEIYEKYLTDVVEKSEREFMKTVLENTDKEKREGFIKARLEDLSFEKEIIEHKIKVSKQFMN